MTDEGHYLLDCALPPGSALDALDVDLRRVPGVVEHGLFVGHGRAGAAGHARGRLEVLTRA